MGIKFIACPQCGEINNPKFLLCWKCKIVFDIDESKRELLAKGFQLTETETELIFQQKKNYFKIWSFLLTIAVGIFLGVMLNIDKFGVQKPISIAINMVVLVLGCLIFYALAMRPRTHTIKLPKRKRSDGVADIKTTSIFHDEKPHGFLWKIYLIFFLFYQLDSRLSMVFDSFNLPWQVIFMGAFVLGMTTIQIIALYSWIWNRKILWLSKFSWIFRMWSFQFFISPFAFVMHLCIVLFTKGDHSESMNWIISILLGFPAMYVMYRLAWKSTLLLENKSRPGEMKKAGNDGFKLNPGT